MISAFKHIRLSGYNVTPISGASYDNSSSLRLGFQGSGLAYYSELTGISGYLANLIETANADVSSLNNLQNGVYITGGDGVTIQVDANLGEIKIVGNSGHFKAITDSLSSNLFETGKTLSEYNTAYSGWANAQFVAKSSNQVFTKTLAPGLDAYQIDFPVSFGGPIPKIQATLEVANDVMYNLSIKSIGTAGYTGLFSDNIAENDVKIHTFASTQN